MKRRPLFLGLLAIVAAVSTIVCSHVPTAAQSQVGKETLTMLTSPDYPPYEFYETKDGQRKIVGFDVDVANYIAKELKFQLKIAESDFNGLVPAVQANRVDFVMAGMTPTPERKKNVDFSTIYYQAQDTIVAPKGANLKKPADLANKQVGVQLGSIQEGNAKKIAEKTAGIQLKPLNKIPEIIQEIRAKRIDAAIIEDTIAKGFVQSNPDLEFNPIPPEGPSGSAIAFPKGSPLIEPFNRALEKMKSSGELDRAAKKWFSINTTAAAAAAETPAAPKAGFNLDFSRIAPDLPFILRGIPVTLGFTITSVLLGLLWATALSLLKISGIRSLAMIADAYTSIFRGTPLLLQLALIYFATPQLTGYNISAFAAAILTFTLNSGAYMSETIRGGILAVDRGQSEAATALGVPYWMMLTDVIFPQALRNILPALVNETIALLKDSALVSTIGVVDLLRSAQIVGANKYIYFEPLLFAGFIYYILVMALTIAASVLERRLRKSE